MQAFTSFVNLTGAVLVVAAFLLSLVALVDLITKNAPAPLAPLVAFMGKNGNLIAFLVALGATVISLIYSDVLGYEPCKLCWYQRIFIYPQALIFGMAYFRKDQGLKLYGIALSAIGFVIAVYHHVGQFGLNPLGLDCLAQTIGACTQNFVLMWGFITIPLMSAAAFLLIALTLILSYRSDKTAAN